jgi:hypothetical protein
MNSDSSTHSSVRPPGSGAGEPGDPTALKPPSDSAVRPFTWRDLTGALDSPRVCIRLGSLRLSSEQQRALRIGSVIRLDHPVDAPAEIVAGRHVLAYGHVVLVDGKLAVQIATRRQPVRRQSA